MQRLLGTACMNVHGYAAPEVMRAFGRAWELCGLVDADEDAATFPVLFGIWIYQLTRGQHARAAEAAADLLQRVQHIDDQGARIAGFLAKAVSLSHIGRPSDARGALRDGNRPVRVGRVSRDRRNASGCIPGSASTLIRPGA